MGKFPNLLIYHHYGFETVPVGCGDSGAEFGRADPDVVRISPRLSGHRSSTNENRWVDPGRGRSEAARIRARPSNGITIELERVARVQQAELHAARPVTVFQNVDGVGTFPSVVAGDDHGLCRHATAGEKRDRKIVTRITTMMYNTDFTEDNKYRGHRAQQLVGKSQSDSVRAVRDDGTLPVHVHASGGQRVRPTARNGKNDKNILKNNNWRGGENGMGQVGY